MKLRRVDPNIIKVPEERVTARMDEEKTEQFEASVKSLGIDEPIRVFEVNGELWLSDGLHRLVSAINNKIDRVDVLVKPGTERDVLFHNLRSGYLRGKHPASEMRKQIEKAYKEFNIGIEDIVKETGLSQEHIEKLLNVSELTPMCLEALDEGRMGVGHAYELTRLKEPDQQEVVLQQLMTYHWTVKRLREYITEVMRIRDQKQPLEALPEPKPPQTVKCRFCQGDFLPEQVASLIICPSCSGIMYESIASARREAREAVAPSLNKGRGTGG